MGLGLIYRKHIASRAADESARVTLPAIEKRVFTAHFTLLGLLKKLRSVFEKNTLECTMSVLTRSRALPCVICLETLGEPSEVTRAGCGDVYHTECILRYVETGHLVCPACRSPLLQPAALGGRVRAYQEAHGRAANDFEAGIETYEEDEEEVDEEDGEAFVERLHQHISTPDGFRAAVRDLIRFSETSTEDISERDYSSAAAIVCAVANAAIGFGAALGRRERRELFRLFLGVAHKVIRHAYPGDAQYVRENYPVEGVPARHRLAQLRA